MADLASDQRRLLARIRYVVGLDLDEDAVSYAEATGFDAGWIKAGDFLFHLRNAQVSRTQRFPDGSRETLEFRDGRCIERWHFGPQAGHSVRPEWN